jgi:integrase
MPTLQKKDIGGRHGLSRAFLQLIERAGIANTSLKEKRGKGRTFHRLTFHALRHTFNSLLAAGGVQQELRMKLMDHRSLRVNDGYTHIELEALKEAVRTLPQLAG